MTEKLILRWNYEKGMWLRLFERNKIPRWWKQWLMKCDQCGVPVFASRPLSAICEKCQKVHYQKFKDIVQPARRAVLRARKAGLLPELDGTIACVDCGAPAEVWDHREYARPLDVDPVCRGCNCKRGPAKEMETLWRKTCRRLAFPVKPATYSADKDGASNAA